VCSVRRRGRAGGSRRGRAAARSDDGAGAVPGPARGGAGGGLARVRPVGRKLVPGAELVLDLTGFDARAAAAGWSTGEGGVDATTSRARRPARCSPGQRRRPLRAVRRIVAPGLDTRAPGAANTPAGRPAGEDWLRQPCSPAERASSSIFRARPRAWRRTCGRALRPAPTARSAHRPRHRRARGARRCSRARAGRPRTSARSLDCRPE
jgi:hypothetical protein